MAHGVPKRAVCRLPVLGVVFLTFSSTSAVLPLNMAIWHTVHYMSHTKIRKILDASVTTVVQNTETGYGDLERRLGNTVAAPADEADTHRERALRARDLLQIIAWPARIHVEK
jgi:hypothetical protein